jgi:hypothetical protein
VQGDDDGIFRQALIIRNELDFCPPVKGRTTQANAPPQVLTSFASLCQINQVSISSQ